MSKRVNKGKSYRLREYEKVRNKRENTEARSIANENVRLIEKPRKPVAPSFIAKYDSGECPKCFVRISKGERVRYDAEGVLHHATHKKAEEPKYVICNHCFLTLPCECEE